MYDNREFPIGAPVLRMGASAYATVQMGKVYRVAAYNPRTPEGLVLEDVEGRWNPKNFEVISEDAAAALEGRPAPRV